MKKFATSVFVVIVAAAAVLALASCKDKEQEIKGTDDYGRVYGEVYAVDSQPSGAFNVPYSIEDTSAIGKTMISANCADYVAVERTQDGYKLTYLCKKGMIGEIKLVGEDGTVSGIEGEKDGYQSFTFDVSEETLKNKIRLQCVVKIMNKTVGFSVVPDLENAKLVG